MIAARRGLTRSMAAAIAVAALGMATATDAAASPDNRHTGSLSMACPAPLGPIEVHFTQPEHAAGGKALFPPDGPSLVIKRLDFTSVETFALPDSGGLSATVTSYYSDESGSRGYGTADRLTTCTGTNVVVDDIVLNPRMAADLNQFAPSSFDWADHIGERLIATHTATFEAHVLVTG